MPKNTPQQLTQLRNSLLSLHKTLLDREHAGYERANGPARGGQLLQLVISHEQFAWLRSISTMVVRIDEALDEPESISFEATRKLVDEVRMLLAPAEAGGHLASTAATHFDRGNAAAPEAIDRVSSRPDFAILGYPVITMTMEHTHQGSRLNLLGENPDPKLVELLSNEKHVTAETPPTFLFHTTDDQAVPVENSVLFYMALRKAGVPAEMHIYERGRHGVGLAPTDLVLSSWPRRLADWLYSRGFLAMPWR